MVAPGRYDLHIQRGEDFSFSFTIDINSVTLDLTDASVYSQVRENDSRAESKIVDFTCKVDGTAVTNPAPTANVIELSLTDVETAAIAHDAGYYDVLVVDSSGNDKYYLEGRVTIHNSVTVKP